MNPATGKSREEAPSMIRGDCVFLSSEQARTMAGILLETAESCEEYGKIEKVRFYPMTAGKKSSMYIQVAPSFAGDETIELPPEEYIECLMRGRHDS